MRDGRVQPFRHLQARLQRKTVDGALLREVPLAYVAFDLLAVGDDLLIDEPLVRRRELLADLVEPNHHLLLAPFEPVEAGTALRCVSSVRPTSPAASLPTVGWIRPT